MPTSRRSILATLAAAATVQSHGPAHAQDSFASFVAGVKSEARRAGIRDQTLTEAFAGVQPNQRVMELDRNQPEFKLTWPEYKARVLPAARLQAARDNYAREQDTLARVEERFGVDRYTVVGIWGVESGFGANRGNYKVVEATATLAWEGRRAAFFRKELMAALKILDAGDVAPGRFLGGYAGAMGQPQFMPTSFLTNAVDFDGDGRRDIWDSKPDVFGSIGNYLARSGWRRGEPWGQPVQVPPDFFAGGREDRRSLAEWMRAGVRRDDGTPFSRSDVNGAVVVPDGAPSNEAYMVYANFAAIRRYNPSDFYALAVGLLGNAASA